jgi:hypothetical protein
MKTVLSSAMILSTLAGSAFAQVQYVSGLGHTPTGNAVLGTPEGRRLPIHNIGSSGQDGVEVHLRSATGGSVGVDIGPALAAGGEIKIKHKGWDGLIYGNHRVSSGTDGSPVLTVDFGGTGVTGLHIQLLDDTGTVISVYEVDGPLGHITVPNFTCPNGGTPYYMSGWRQVCPTCPPFFWQGWVCVGPNGEDMGTFTTERIIVTPQVGPGLPSLPDMESMILGAAGVPGMTVAAASLDTFGVQCWGVGGAQIGEVCDVAVGCDDSSLLVSNLGSSGQDGVSIDPGPNAGEVEVQMGKGNCCRGHVTLLKAYDDGGSEMRVSRTLDDILPDGSTLELIEADFTALGATGYVVTCYDGAGNPIGEPQAFIGGGSPPVFTNRCPPGSIEKWINVGTPNNPVWWFDGCIGQFHRMAFPSGVAYEGVASFSLTPLGQTVPTSGKIRHVVITKNGTEMELKRVIVRPPNNVPACGTADFDGDGDIGTDGDIESFFACLAGTCCPTCYSGGADFNADGDIGTDADIESFFRVLAGGPC